MLTSELFTKPEFQSSALWFEITTTYKKLVEIFWEPNDDSDWYKTQAQWRLMGKDGFYFTIYDYKQGKQYCGDEEWLDVENVTEWHIGIQQGGWSTPVALIMHTFDILWLL